MNLQMILQMILRRILGEENITPEDRRHLERTVTLAEQALANQTFPIAAVIVGPDNQSYEAQNEVYSKGVGVAHAEQIIFWMEEVGLKPLTGSWILYGSMEPCLSCMGAIWGYPGIVRVVCLIGDPTSRGGIWRMIPYTYFIFEWRRNLRRTLRKLGVRLGGDGVGIRLKRPRKGQGFTVVIADEDGAVGDLVRRTRNLWLQYAEIAPRVRERWTRGQE